MIGPHRRYTTPVAALGASPPPPPSPLLTGLLAWYRGNGTDRSGNNRNLSGSPNSTTGFDGAANGAMYFDNFSTFQRAAFVSGTTYGFSAWAAIHGSSVVNVYQVMDDFITNVPYLFADTTKVRFGNYSLGTFTGAEYGTGLTEDQWYHLAGTYDGTNAKVYVNGVLVQTTAAGITIGTPNFNGFKVGDGNGGGNWAKLQFLGVWSRTIDQSDIDLLYASGAGYDPTA